MNCTYPLEKKFCPPLPLSIFCFFYIGFLLSACLLYLFANCMSLLFFSDSEAVTCPRNLSISNQIKAVSQLEAKSYNHTQIMLSQIFLNVCFTQKKYFEKRIRVLIISEKYQNIGKFGNFYDCNITESIEYLNCKYLYNIIYLNSQNKNSSNFNKIEQRTSFINFLMHNSKKILR